MCPGPEFLNAQRRACDGKYHDSVQMIWIGRGRSVVITSYVDQRKVLLFTQFDWQSRYGVLLVAECKQSKKIVVFMIYFVFNRFIFSLNGNHESMQTNGQMQEQKMWFYEIRKCVFQWWWSRVVVNSHNMTSMLILIAGSKLGSCSSNFFLVYPHNTFLSRIVFRVGDHRIFFK